MLPLLFEKSVMFPRGLKKARPSLAITDRLFLVPIPLCCEIGWRAKKSKKAVAEIIIDC